LLAALVVVNLPVSFAAEPVTLRFVRISVDQGLSQATVRAILQDRHGFLWVGTHDGLNRYDGYTFTVYKHNPADPRSLGNNWILSLYEDKAGNLWIGTDSGGLNLFERDTETFKRYTHTPNDPTSLSHDRVWAITEDQAGTLWVGTYGGGLNRFDREKGTFTHYKRDRANLQSLSTNYIFSLLPDPSGDLWVGTESGGLDRLQKGTSTFVHYRSDPANPHSLSHNNVRSLHLDRSGTLWVGTQEGLNKFDRASQTFTRYVRDPKNPQSLSQNTVTSILEDSIGTLWIATHGGGLNRFDRETETFSYYQNKPTDPTSLSGDLLWTLYEDRAGTLWIGTAGNALNKRTRAKFSHYAQDPAHPGGLPFSYTTMLYADSSDTVWIGSRDSGFCRFEPNDGAATCYSRDLKTPKSLSENFVTAMVEDRDGVLWVGTLGGGLNRFDRTTATFTHYRHNRADPKSLSHDIIFALLEDQSGNLWIGTLGSGLDRFDPASHTFVHYTHNPDDPRSLGANGVLSLHEDQSGALWVGTYEGGLNRFDRDSGTFTRFTAEPANPRSLSNNTITSIYEDASGALWLTTLDGLNRFDKKTGTCKQYREADGLANNVTYGVLADGQGNLWISTNKGLSKLDPRTDTFRNYDVSDGLQSNEFNQAAYCRTKRGEMFFGGINGFNVFRPEEVKDNPHAPPMAITAFKKFDRTVPLREIASPNGELVLSFSDNFFAFEFAALDYASPAKNQYAYKLEGFDPDWIQCGTRRYASYTNLDPGEYVFRVKGSNADGVWNEAGTAVKIIILPPLWRTWWAYGFYLLLIGGAIVGTIRYQTRKLERERHVAEQLRKADKLKDEFLANTSHELRTPLTGIIGLAESLIDGATGSLPDATKKNLALITSSGKRLAHLVNDILDFSRLKHRDLVLQKQPVDLRTLTDVVLTLSHPLVMGKPLGLKNDIESGIPLVDADETRLQQIMHNLVGNAIKFTESGSVTVSARAASDFVEVTVADTGIGIPPEKIDDIFQSFEQVDTSITRRYGGTGLGLAVTKQLVELHGGEIRAESTLGEGSRLIFTLPVSREQVAPNENAAGPVPGLAHIQADDRVQSATALADPIVGADHPTNGEGRIMAVDDEPINIQVLTNLLALERYTVVPALSGADALRKLDELESKPDLVLLDVMMPGMSGYEVCRHIRRNYSAADLPVIMLTAKTQVADLVEGLTVGANDYLAKPFSKNELLARIKTHLQLAKATQETKELAALHQELEIARQIQQSILPSSSGPFPERKEFEIHAEMIPAKEVGGDFYDFFLIDDERLGFLVADVSGKGIPAALFMILSRTHLRSTALEGLPPDECLQKVNHLLSAANESSMFVTVLYGIRHTRTGEIHYSVAGHDPAYWLKRDGTVVRLDEPRGIVLGLSDEARYETGRLALAPGEALFLYTDGVTEAMKSTRERFSPHRLEAGLRQMSGVSLSSLTGKIVEEVKDFSAGAAESDDITVLALRYLGTSSFDC
jgi:signal transduction histidine kinase/serine phosphatase RsbU (regulator of sigma subunit)/ligand-binding sensor domain-containing protein